MNSIRLLLSCGLFSTIVIDSIQSLSISSRTSMNQWASEEKFCANILQPCQCFVNAETNLLSVHCKGDERIVNNNLDQILIRIAQTVDDIQFDELILENFTKILAINFTKIQRVPVKTIRIFNCQHLESFSGDDRFNLTSTLAQSLIEIELSGNKAIDSDQLFKFLYTQFPRLQSIILSSINYQQIPVFNRNQNNKCLPWKRLIFNHRCTSPEQQRQPIIIEQKDQFIDLCNVRWLDLSCMNLKHINQMAIMKLCQNLNVTSTTTNGRQLHVDLSYNPLLNIDQWTGDDDVHIEF
ncbi:hypothetical protein DERF_004622 [Dermatophagoides farinae]|uniref:Uncharacterized protein n=1 Tax=Dermatophagoides farinae TaxID=6954 RepID=A0A922L5R0_DERFA|nr:hypothetical protein DERF_004622 [Dermatophagoides farinae]